MLRSTAFVVGLIGCGLLAGCKEAVLQPAGPVGERELRLIAETFGAMLIVVIPVIVMALVFPFRYRARTSHAPFRPDWDFSRPLEIVIWTVPFAIVLFLGIMIWRSTLELDPYKPIPKIAGTALTVDVVALDWKWLFIYPDQKIASINQLVIPAGQQVQFDITSDAAMNVFFIPQLGTQIYAMSGMETRLHLLASKPGTFRGIAANFSGPGFADMRFETDAVDQADFDAWVKRAQAAPVALDDMTFQYLAGGTKNNPPMLMRLGDQGLFGRIMGAANGVAKLPAVATE